MRKKNITSTLDYLSNKDIENLALTTLFFRHEVFEYRTYQKSLDLTKKVVNHELSLDIVKSSKIEVDSDTPDIQRELEEIN